MARPLQPVEPRPMLEMNTTPLIDVLLVLLIMFIITIPIQSHAVKIDLPRPCPTCAAPDPVSNTVVIAHSGQILWNGHAIDRDGLKHMLGHTQRMWPVPELHLRPESSARYELVDEVLAITTKADVERMGFVGNEAYLNAF